MQRAQRLALLAGLVLGLCEQRPAPLPQRRGGDLRLRLSQHLPVPPDAQERVHARLLGLEAQLPQPGGLDLRRFPPVELGERLALPQRERLAEDEGRALRLAHRQQLPAARDLPLEALDVDLLERHDQAVAAAGRLDRVAAQGATEPHDAALHELLRRRRRSRAPERIGQPLRGDDLAGAHRQRGQHDPVPRREGGGTLFKAQRTQQVDPQGPGVSTRP